MCIQHTHIQIEIYQNNVKLNVIPLKYSLKQSFQGKIVTFLLGVSYQTLLCVCGVFFFLIPLSYIRFRAHSISSHCVMQLPGDESLAGSSLSRTGTYMHNA